MFSPTTSRQALRYLFRCYLVSGVVTVNAQYNFYIDTAKRLLLTFVVMVSLAQSHIHRKQSFLAEVTLLRSPHSCTLIGILLRIAMRSGHVLTSARIIRLLLIALRLLEYGDKRC